MDVLTVVIYPSVAIFISGFVGWFFGRKRNASEVTGIDLDNAKEIIQMYKEFSSEMKLDNQTTREVLKESQKIIEKFNSKCIQPSICKE